MNDVYSVIYSPKAKDDLREIYVYIAFDLQSPDTAKGQVNHIRKKIRSLNLFGNPSPNNKDVATRHLVIPLKPQTAP